MNPSTQDLLNAFKDLPTDKVIILPNNKNIIMAAEATRKLSDKKVEIIPTRKHSPGPFRLPAVEPRRGLCRNCG